MALSQLNPQIIGAEMEHGFAGSYARQPDMIVVTRPVGEKEPLPFGMALMYDANGAVVLMQCSGVTADRFAGVAGREMRSALSYTDQNTGAYTTGVPSGATLDCRPVTMPQAWKIASGIAPMRDH